MAEQCSLPSVQVLLVTIVGLFMWLHRLVDTILALLLLSGWQVGRLVRRCAVLLSIVPTDVVCWLVRA